MVDKNFTPIPKKTLQKVIQEEESLGKKLSEEEWVDLIYRGIGDLDNSINTFKACKKLSLSSNIITRIPEIQLDNLEILSLGRNKIRYIKGLDFVAKTLKQLWISYNEIDKLDALKNMVNLEVLYIGNNLIAKIDELNYLTGLFNLRDVVFKGNPFCLIDGNITKPQDKDKTEIYPEIKKRIPSVTVIDGDLVI